MKLYANAWDPWNPLFNDETYAKNTKYGSIIAIPCWKEPGAMFPTLPMNYGDKLQRANDGGAFTMYAPILPGDTFTTVCDDMIIEDLTPPEGSTGRYMRLEGRGSLYNQRGELVMHRRHPGPQRLFLLSGRLHRPQGPPFGRWSRRPGWSGWKRSSNAYAGGPSLYRGGLGIHLRTLGPGEDPRCRAPLLGGCLRRRSPHPHLFRPLDGNGYD